MFNFQINGATKQIFYVCITFQALLFRGISRAYPSFFFYQLDYPDSGVKLENSQQSWIAAYVTLLSPIGSFLSGSCMDQFGRRHTLKLIYLPFIVSWLMLSFSKNLTVFYVAFLLQGIGIGMSYSVGIYVSEITTPNYRSALFSLTVMTYNVGILLSNFLMYYLPWETVSFIFFTIGIAALIMNYFLPESPFWLYMQGETEKSVQTLCNLRCSNENQLLAEIQDIENFCNLKKVKEVEKVLQNCLKAWKQLSIVIVYLILTLHSGNVIFPVSLIKIINRLKVPYDGAQLNVNYSFFGVLTGFIMPYFFHKFNRRTVLATSSFGMGISMIAVAFQYRYDFNSKFAWIVPTAFYFYSFFVNIGMLPIIFSIGGELLPNESRGVLIGICGTISFLYMSFIQKIFPFYMATFGIEVSIWTFAVINFILTAFAICILPETRGKSLNQIQEEYFRRKSKNLSPIL